MTVTALNSTLHSDRALAALFAPIAVREGLLKLYAWTEEIETIPFKAKDPAIQAMRFAWHRDAVSDLFASPQKVRRHAAYEGMAQLIDGDVGASVEALNGVIDAVEDGTLPERVADDGTLLSIMDRHHGALTHIAIRICDKTGRSALEETCARVVGLAHWCRAFGLRAGTKMALMPETALAAAEFNIHRLATGREPDIARAAFDGVINLLSAELDRMQRGEKCPPDLFPALGPARLARATLKTLNSADDLYRTDFHRPQIARQFDLLKASLSGRL